MQAAATMSPPFVIGVITACVRLHEIGALATTDSGDVDLRCELCAAAKTSSSLRSGLLGESTDLATTMGACSDTSHVMRNVLEEQNDFIVGVPSSLVLVCHSLHICRILCSSGTPTRQPIG